jgi:hypothetical protein
MAATVATIGFGMTLGYCATSNGSYTTLVDLIEIKPAGLKVGVADATHHASPNAAMESAPGLIDFEPLDFKISWTKTAQPAMTALLRLSRYWKVTYPDGSTDVFPGFIIEIAAATPIKERMETHVKIHPTGLSTFTAAS